MKEYSIQEIHEMLSILKQIYSALKDKSENSPKNNLKIYELGWLISIDDLLDKLKENKNI